MLDPCSTIVSSTNFGRQSYDLIGSSLLAATCQVILEADADCQATGTAATLKTSDNGGTDDQGNPAIGNWGSMRWLKLITATNNMAGGDDGLTSDSANTTALIGNAAAADKMQLQQLAVTFF